MRVWQHSAIILNEILKCFRDHFRDPQGGSSDEAESVKKGFEKDDICPWDSRGAGTSTEDKRKKLGIASCAGSMASEEIWENETNTCLNAFDPRVSRKNSSQLDSGSSSSELSLAIVEVSERLRRTCGITQQSSFPEGEESRLRKLSTTSADNVDPRRSSIAVSSLATREGHGKSPPWKSSPGKDTKGAPQETVRLSASSTEGPSVISPITAVMPLPQQVTVLPQRSSTADTSPDKFKDNKFDDEISRTNKKSESGVTKKSSLSATPLISVSSVTEDVCVEEETPTPKETRDETEEKEKEQQQQQAKPETTEKSEASAEGEPAEGSDDKAKEEATVSNWEEEWVPVLEFPRLPFEAFLFFYYLSIYFQRKSQRSFCQDLRNARIFVKSDTWNFFNFFNWNRTCGNWSFFVVRRCHVAVVFLQGVNCWVGGKRR